MSSAAEREQLLLKKRLEALLKLPGNLQCADCPSRCVWPGTGLCLGLMRGRSHASPRSASLGEHQPGAVHLHKLLGARYS